MEEARRKVGPAAAFELIFSRSFGPYIAGTLASSFGFWFFTLPSALLIYRQTHSEFQLGVLAFAQFIPLLVLAPWAGAAADRFDRGRVAGVTQVASAILGVLVAVLAAADLAPPVVVITIGAVIGVCMAFLQPSLAALAPGLVKPADLQTAVGVTAIVWNLARALGPALAAAAVGGLGIPSAFGIMVACHLVAVVGFWLSRPREVTRTAGTSFRESLSLVLRDPPLIVFLVVAAAVAVAADPINTLTPAYANVFGHPDTFSGVLIGVFGAGAVTAGLVLSGRTFGSRRAIAVMVAMCGGGHLLFSVLPILPLALVFLFASGFGLLAAVSAASAQLQLRVADAVRGRIMALFGIAYLGLRPFASIVDGAIASGPGVRVAGAVLPIPALLLAAALAWTVFHRRQGPSLLP